VNSHKRDWEELGTLDPMWAIYSDPTRKYGKWDLDEFFATGEQDVDRLMGWVAERGYPKHRESALDFGCGIGRLTRALARHFQRAYGVDIAGTMVARARQLNSGISNCEFLTTDDCNLASFPDHHFDLIYTKWVLQHLPDREAIRPHLIAFVRCLKPDGLLVFQLRTGLSLKARLQLGESSMPLSGGSGSESASSTSG
jgi:SAM-dependent methyltransferase